MTHLAAFLRAINVGGGHTIKMAALREIFQGFGFSNVSTLLASGNMVFETDEKDLPALEKRIETGLLSKLGYSVETFLRTDSELAAISKYRPHSMPAEDPKAEWYIIFLKTPVRADTVKRVEELKSELDEFHVRGSEIYWLRRRREGSPPYSTVALEKALGLPFTIRSAKTVEKMVGK